MRTKLLTMIAVLASSLVKFSMAAESEPNLSQKQIGKSSNAFASDLYTQLAAKEGNPIRLVLKP